MQVRAQLTSKLAAAPHGIRRRQPGGHVLALDGRVPKASSRAQLEQLTALVGEHSDDQRLLIAPQGQRRPCAASACSHTVLQESRGIAVGQQRWLRL